MATIGDMADQIEKKQIRADEVPMYSRNDVQTELVRRWLVRWENMKLVPARRYTETPAARLVSELHSVS